MDFQRHSFIKQREAGRQTLAWRWFLNQL